MTNIEDIILEARAVADILELERGSVKEAVFLALVRQAHQAGRCEMLDEWIAKMAVQAAPENLSAS
jgi:hypothetical protein